FLNVFLQFRYFFLFHLLLQEFGELLIYKLDFYFLWPILEIHHNISLIYQNENVPKVHYKVYLVYQFSWILKKMICIETLNYQSLQFARILRMKSKML